MAVRAATGKGPDTYDRLVKKFRLTRIRDEEHLEEAQEVIDRLLGQELDRGAREYLDALTALVEGYEGEHHPIPDASEADVLRLLMPSGGLSQARLAGKGGIAQSTLSAVLNGVRSLTKEQVVALAAFFHVAPGAFLPAPGKLAARPTVRGRRG